MLLLAIPLVISVSSKDKTTNEIYEKVKSIDTKLNLYGTEYQTDENATIWLQVLKNYLPINDANCFAMTYYPNKTIFLNDVGMSYLEGSDGLYYYDLTTPETTGVYMLSATCYVPSNSFIDDFNDYSKLEAYENITISSGKAKLSSYNLTFAVNYTDGVWEGSELIAGLGDGLAVDFDLGSISTINTVQLCYYSSREKTTVLANVSIGSTITQYNLTLPVLAQPTSWFCAYVPVTLFTSGINRIGFRCYKGCTSADNVVTKFDASSPDNGSYWWENSTQIWHLKTDRDYAIKVIYIREFQNTNGYLRSVPITLNETSWESFFADYTGTVGFKILNSSNNTICSGLGSISTCAGSISPIKLHANLTSNAMIDKWGVTWYVGLIEEIRGSGEMHITLPSACDLTNVTNSIVSVNDTVKSGFADLNTTLNSIVSYLTNIPSDVWNYATRTLTFYPIGLNASDVWSYTPRTLTSFGTLISDVWDYTTRILTFYPIGLNASDVWNYPDRSVINATFVQNVENVTTVYNVTSLSDSVLDDIALRVVKYFYALKDELFKVVLFKW
jgi:hypothetical protein